jgi:hypothetical protein
LTVLLVVPSKLGPHKEVGNRVLPEKRRRLDHHHRHEDKDVLPVGLRPLFKRDLQGIFDMARAKRMAILVGLKKTGFEFGSSRVNTVDNLTAFLTGTHLKDLIRKWRKASPNHTPMKEADVTPTNPAGKNIKGL